MVRTFDFLAPSLHPNTLVDISIPEPGPSTIDPVVRNLPIKYGTFNSVGGIKRIAQTSDGKIIVADDAFNITTLKLEENDDHPAIPTVIAQENIPHKAGQVWSGLTSVAGGTISALTSGLLTLHPTSNQPSSSRTISSPLLAVSSTGHQASILAIGGKEVDVSLWDVETTFNGSSSGENTGKRKKTELERGEIWRAKNMPNNSLALRPPNHHLCLTHLPLSGPNHLASGTKSGTVRTYDTRQRKPVHEWKAAREGGVGSISQGHSEYEVFFSDGANLLGALDTRNGRLIHSYPNMSCTAHHLLPIPLDDTKSNIGLATIASDATLRIHSILPPKKQGEKGNNNGKAKVEGMVGGVGIANFLWTGFGSIDAPIVKKAKADDDDEDDDGDDDEDDDEEVWVGMSEVEDEGSSDSEEEEVAPKKKSAKRS